MNVGRVLLTKDRGSDRVRGRTEAAAVEPALSLPLDARLVIDRLASNGDLNVHVVRESSAVNRLMNFCFRRAVLWLETRGGIIHTYSAGDDTCLLPPPAWLAFDRGRRPSRGKPEKIGDLKARAVRCFVLVCTVRFYSNSLLRA